MTLPLLNRWNSATTLPTNELYQLLDDTTQVLGQEQSSIPLDQLNALAQVSFEASYQRYRDHRYQFKKMGCLKKFFFGYVLLNDHERFKGKLRLLRERLLSFQESRYPELKKANQIFEANIKRNYSYPTGTAKLPFTVPFCLDLGLVYGEHKTITIQCNYNPIIKGPRKDILEAGLVGVSVERTNLNAKQSALIDLIVQQQLLKAEIEQNQVGLLHTNWH